MKPRKILISGLILMLLAVALGAFGAHALKSMMSAAQLTIWKTASNYHFYHALALIGLGIWAERHAQAKAAVLAGILFIGGILVFSGSLYLLAVSGVRWLGMLTPIGGVLFLAGWVSWLMAVINSPPSNNRQDAD